MVLEKVQHEILESPVKVYNFEVEDFHTYFVGEEQVWVHNICAKISNGNTAKATKGVRTTNGHRYFSALKKELGSAGKGKDWHHIAEQSQINKSGFVPEQIHNADNVIAIDHATHMRITGYYNTKSFRFTDGLSVREWLAGQSYEIQYDFGRI